MRIAAYIQGLPKAIAAAVQGNTTFVVGNESCDLDSFVSSLLTAYFLSQANHAAFPLINVARAELRIRSDIVHLLDDLGLSSESLVFLDSVTSDTDVGRLALQSSVFLVDHNKITDELEPVFKDRVVGIIDHHANENLYSQSLSQSGGPRITLKAGSCTSLVINYWKQRLADNWSAMVDSDLARLAVAPILIDTSNMTSKVEPPDVEALGTLSNVLGSQFAREAFYTTLLDKKRDLNALSTSDILRKDYKQWRGKSVLGKPATIGISSVPASLEYLKDHDPNLKQALERFSQEKDLDLYIMTAASKHPITGKGQRQQAVWYKPEYKDLVTQYSRAFPDLLDLVPTGVLLDFDAGIESFQQRRASASRKVVAPCLRQVVFGTSMESL